MGHGGVAPPQSLMVTERLSHCLAHEVPRKPRLLLSLLISTSAWSDVRTAFADEERERPGWPLQGRPERVGGAGGRGAGDAGGGTGRPRDARGSQTHGPHSGASASH